jgi:hypothetical protein
MILPNRTVQKTGGTAEQDDSAVDRMADHMAD